MSGGDDRKIVVWDLETRKPIATLAVDQRIPYMLWSTKGDKFVAWQSSTQGEAETNNFKTYDPDGKPLNSLDLKDRSVLCTHVHDRRRNGRSGVRGRLGSAVEPEEQLTRRRRLGGVQQGPGGHRRHPGQEEGHRVGRRVQRQDVRHREEGGDQDVPGPQGEPERHPGRPGRNRFASISDNGEVKLWETDTGKELRAWSLPTPVRNIAFSADGKKLITANGDTTLYVLNLP